MEIFVSVGEASSDIHCAHLLDELKNHFSTLTSFGLGGDALAATGTTLFMHIREFSVAGGPLEVISKLPKRRTLEHLYEQRFFNKKPDLAILVDSGEINLRLASLLHFFNIPVIYFIPPKVWVWRHSRIEKIAQHVNLVLGILPFEEPMYKEWNVPFRYVGNPLIDEIPENLTVVEAKRKLGIAENTETITVMPGSRHTEIKQHVELFSKAIKLFNEKMAQKPEILVPVAPSMELDSIQSAFKDFLPEAKFFKEAGISHYCLKASRAALVKSGTSTLEAGVLGTPMVLAYHSSKSAEWIYKHIVRYKGYVGLVNLFLAKSPEAALGWAPPEVPVVSELILKKCTVENIARDLFEVYSDGATRDQMLKELSRTRNLLAPPKELGASPTKAAAAAIVELLRAKGVADVA